MPKKKWTRDTINEAIMNGAETCPSCEAGWTKPKDAKGKEMKNPPNLVLIHEPGCAAYNEPTEAQQ